MNAEPDPNQLVADLAWAINSAPLVELGNETAWASIDPAAVDVDELADFMNVRAERRVGHYFENLVHYWLKHVRGVEMVAHRQPVREAGRTLGELDFVFRDEADRLTHWEAAVKFYLLTNETPPRYLGPNTADSLARKIRRLREHQLPLSARCYEDVVIRGAFVKGRIYHHVAAVSRPTIFPELHPRHLRGAWLHRSELSAALALPEARSFTVLKKPFWLTPTADRRSIKELERTVEDHFAHTKAAMHLALFDAQGGESHRWFVVPDDWPD